MLVGSGVVFARMLGPQDRGYLALLSLWPSALWQLGSLGLQVSAAYYIAQKPTNARAIATILARVGAIQVTILIAIHAGIIAWYLPGRPAYLVLPALISLMMVPPSLARQYMLGILQGQRRFGAFNLGRFLPSFLTTLGAGALWFGHIRGLTPAIAVLVSTSYISALVTLLAGRDLRRAEPSASVPTTRQMLSFGMKALPSAAYPVESFKLDQLFAGLALSPAALGLYVVASSFTNLPRFASQSVGFVAYPNVAAAKTPKERHEAVWHFFWITLVVVTPLVVVLAALMGLLIPFFFGEQFSASVPVAQILVVAGLFLALRRSWFDGLRGAGFPLVGTLSEISSWVVLLGAMFTLAPRWHVIGVAVAVVLSAVASMTAVLIAEAVLVRRGTWASATVDTPTTLSPEALTGSNASL